MLCIICKKEKDESEEHIIPESLGNKKLVTQRVCGNCNHRLGANVDDYLTNHNLVKLIRMNENLLGKKGSEIKFFDGVETDEKTGLKFDMKTGRPILMPRMIDNGNGLIRIEAANVEECFAHFKKKMKRRGYSEEQIDELCKDVTTGEIEFLSSPEFKKDATLDFSRFDLSAIKIAYEYAFTMLGEKYLDDTIAKIFSRELYKNAYSSKQEIMVSDELAQYVTFPIYGSGIEKLLSEIKKGISDTNMDILHVIFTIKQDGCLYCILHLCMADIITFAIKITEHAECYEGRLPITFVFRNGNVLNI